jgi:hypothetical protein
MPQLYDPLPYQDQTQGDEEKDDPDPYRQKPCLRTVVFDKMGFYETGRGEDERKEGTAQETQEDRLNQFSGEFFAGPVLSLKTDGTGTSGLPKTWTRAV